MENDLILKVNALRKEYDSHQVLRNLSFEIRRGNRVALFAPSGAGKTTLIKILSKLESPTSGSFSINDSRPSVLFQEPRLFPYLTVEENILLPFRIRKCSPSSATLLEYKEWLSVCELSNWNKKYPHQLSGGMKQKTALIRGLLSHPGFVMLDEPFQSIGPASKAAIIAHIRKTNPDLTMLFTTHNIEEIPLLAQTVLFFSTNQLTCPIKLDAHQFENLYLKNFENIYSAVAV